MIKPAMITVRATRKVHITLKMTMRKMIFHGTSPTIDELLEAPINN